MIYCQSGIKCPNNLQFLYKKSFDKTPALRAGIIPFIIDAKGETYVLLGKDKSSGKWSDLGGRRDKGETILDNAVREFLEESRSVLPLDLNNLTRVIVSRIRNGIQALLIVQVMATEDVININKKFQKTIPRSKYEDEMSELRWIRYDEFKNAENVLFSKSLKATRQVM